MLFWSTIKLKAPHLLRTRSLSPCDKTIQIPLHTRPMARLTGKALVEDIANTVIEDSEPERQAEAVIQKEQRKQQRRKKSKNNEQPGPEVSDKSITEVPPGRDSTEAPFFPQHLESGVIETSGMTVRCHVP